MGNKWSFPSWNMVVVGIQEGLDSKAHGGRKPTEAWHCSYTEGSRSREVTERTLGSRRIPRENERQGRTKGSPWTKRETPYFMRLLDERRDCWQHKFWEMAGKGGHSAWWTKWKVRGNGGRVRILRDAILVCLFCLMLLIFSVAWWDRTKTDYIKISVM